jgi:hypothetical protein
MSINQLGFGIHKDLCAYPDLQILSLSGNPLSSTIPSCIGALPSET